MCWEYLAVDGCLRLLAAAVVAVTVAVSDASGPPASQGGSGVGSRQITVPQPPEPGCRGRRPTAVMDLPSAAGPDWRRVVYLFAALAGVAAGLAIGLCARATARWIPADARVVTVTPVFGVSPASAVRHPASWEKPWLSREELNFSREEKFDHAFTITDRATVARIAAVINGFNPVGPGTYNCPASMSDPTMQLTFRASLGGPVVASVTAEYQGCQWVWVTIGARTLPALFQYTSSEQPMQQRVLTIARVSWPYPLK
jgi:hypothetical protein